MTAESSQRPEKPAEKKSLGLIHVLFGNGVGKTSAAVGLAFRALGAGFDVHFVQFMKSGKSSEFNQLRKVPNFHYYCPGDHPFLLGCKPKNVHIEHAQKGMEYALKAVQDAAHMLVCDELLNTLHYEILTKEIVLDLMDRCRNKVELVITGKAAHPEIIQHADYVNEFIKIKHPYDSGVKSRLGIEF